MFRPVRRDLVLLLTLLAGACGSSTPTTSTPTTTTTITDTFAGTLTLNGATTFPFAVPNTGTVTASMVSISPDSTILLGLALGTWNGTACQIILADDSATQGTNIPGTTTAAGNLCVRVYDTGHLTNPESFEVSVTHP